MITSDFIAKASASLYSFTPPTLYDNFFFLLLFLKLPHTLVNISNLGWLPSISCLHLWKEPSFTEQQNIYDFEIL
jgi:hypothetical protein